MENNGKCPECGAVIIPPGNFCEGCGLELKRDESYGEKHLDLELHQNGVVRS